ncbi:MAG: cytochrome c nitrite reductase small subunit [Phycisphaerales bacterium]
MKRVIGISVFGLILAAVIGVFLGLSASTFTYAEGASYLSNDPRACVNCHIMREQYDAWQKSLHHAHAACNDCHVPHDPIGKYMAKAEHGYRHSKAFTFQDFHEPIRITPGDLKIVEANCVRCHSRMVEEITAHAEATSCVHCHKGIGHGPSR